MTKSLTTLGLGFSLRVAMTCHDFCSFITGIFTSLGISPLVGPRCEGSTVEGGTG